MESPLDYSRTMLKIAVCRISSQIGWVSSNESCLELLTDILENRILHCSKLMHNYAENFGRTEPHFGDLELTFQDMCITESELKQYADAVIKYPNDAFNNIPDYPYERPSELRIPKANKKLLNSERPEYIDDYFPLFSQDVSDLDRSTTETSTTASQESPSKRVTASNKALPDEAGHSQYVPRSVMLQNGIIISNMISGVAATPSSPPPAMQTLPISFFNKPKSTTPMTQVNVVDRENEDGFVDIEVDVNTTPIPPKPIDPTFTPKEPVPVKKRKQPKSKAAQKISQNVTMSNENEAKRLEREAKRRRLEQYADVIDSVIMKTRVDWAVKQREKEDKEFEELLEVMDKKMKIEIKAAKKAKKRAAKLEQKQQQNIEKLEAPISSDEINIMTNTDKSEYILKDESIMDHLKVKKKKHKDKDKSKKEKKRLKKEKERERLKRDSIDPSLVPKLTLKLNSGGHTTNSPIPTDDNKLLIKDDEVGMASASPEKEHQSSPPKSLPCHEVIPPKVKTAAQKKQEASMTILTETVSLVTQGDGERVWICPKCSLPDDGSPMIGCDNCDDWYHWVCVGIIQEPPDNQRWFCPKCCKTLKNLSPKKKVGRKPKKKI